MLTGFNTDVLHEGRTYHVQTEDKGADNPLIETLIYLGGAILASRRRSYAELSDNGSGPVDREKVSQLIERQHQAVVRDIRLGKYDPPELRKPFGEGIITDRSMDEVIKEFIEEAGADGSLPPPAGRGEPGGKS